MSPLAAQHWILSSLGLGDGEGGTQAPRAREVSMNTAAPQAGGGGEPADVHGHPACSPEKPVPAERWPDCLEVSPHPGTVGDSRAMLQAHWDSVLSTHGSSAGNRSGRPNDQPKDGGLSELAIRLLPLDWPTLGHWGRLSLASRGAGTGGWMLLLAESLTQPRFL